jgi:hypothetical protein
MQSCRPEVNNAERLNAAGLHRVEVANAVGLALQVIVHVFQPVVPIFDVGLALLAFELLLFAELVIERERLLQPIVTRGLGQLLIGCAGSSAHQGVEHRGDLRSALKCGVRVPQSFWTRGLGMLHAFLKGEILGWKRPLWQCRGCRQRRNNCT